MYTNKFLAHLTDKAANWGQREGGGQGFKDRGDSCSRATVAHLSGHASAGS